MATVSFRMLFLLSTVFLLASAVKLDHFDSKKQRKMENTTETNDPYIQDFRDRQMGIAFTVLPYQSWKYPKRGREIFHNDPSKHHRHVSAISITNQFTKISPFTGYTMVGLAFSLREQTGLHRHFAVNNVFKKSCPSAYVERDPHGGAWKLACNDSKIKQKIGICGRCSDGGVCAGSWNNKIEAGTKSGKWPALVDQISYSEFSKMKNDIVAASGSMETCPTANMDSIWNEFDVNGFPPQSVVGILVDRTRERGHVFREDTSGYTVYDDRPVESYYDDWEPSDRVMCHYLKINVNETRKEWPVYDLSWARPNYGHKLEKDDVKPSILTLNRTLSC